MGTVISQYLKPFNCEKKNQNEMSTGLFKNVIHKMCLQIVYI